MKIKNRFILLFSVLCITFLAIGTFTFHSFRRIERMNQVDKHFHQLYAHALEMRKFEEDYLSNDLITPNYFETGKSAYIAQFDSAHKLSIAICKELINSSDTKKMRVLHLINKTEKDLNQYKFLFRQLTEGKQRMGFKNWGIEGEMRRSIHAVESQIENNHSQAFKVHMLTLRRHEKDYLLRREKNYIDRFYSELSAFKHTIQSSRISTMEKENLQNLLVDYHKKFLLLTETDQQIGYTRSEGIMKQLGIHVGQTIDQIDQAKQIVSSRSQAFIHDALIALIVFIVICASIAALMGYYTFRSITKVLGGEPEDVAIIADNIAKGNLRLKFDAAQSYQGIMKSVVTMTQKLSAIIEQIHQSSEQVVMATGQFSATSQLVSEGAANQAYSIDEIAASIENIHNKTKKNSEDAHETEKLAAFIKAGVGSIKKQADLSLKTNKTIAQKTEMINHITKQTKILALNASVEAARAGALGGGFHVIADEVKRLAEMTELTASEINRLVTESLVESENVNRMVSSVLSPVEKTAQLVQQIADASEEQNLAVLIVNNNVQSLYNMSQENATVSEEMAANTEELDRQTIELKHTIAYFEYEFDDDQGNKIIHLQAEKKKKKKKKMKHNQEELAVAG